MAQEYDKIFKENIEAIILPLVEKILNMGQEVLEEIPDNLQRTIERKPDFLKKTIHADKSKDFILQIDFQSTNDDEMVYRMHEYCSMLLRKYRAPIKQYVFYIGTGKAKMQSSLQFEDLQYRFHLINIQDYDYKLFINSNNPEEVILAILADFGDKSPEEIIEKILKQLKSLKIETIRKEKSVIQLEILSGLRNLQAEVIEKQKYMPITYDLEKDIRFQQGEKKGEKKAQERMIERLLKESSMGMEEIARIAEASLDYVKSIAMKIKGK